MKNVEARLREEAKKLLSEKKVALIVGYEAGTLPLTATPCFISTPEEADKLIYNPVCVHNLAAYVTEIISQHRDSQKRLKPEEKTKKIIGIVARGCTSRSLVIHLQEKQYERDEVVIIGVPCCGYVDGRKLAAGAAGREIIGGVLGDDKIQVQTATGTKELVLAEVMADNCQTCRFNNPVISDIMLGDAAAPPQDINGEYRRVDQFASLPEEERWAYFAKEMDKCLRCYACRNACPSCYCRSCFVEQSQPQWVGRGTEHSDSEVFQIMRIFHMAGRCVDCGSCISVCPMNVDLRTFLKKLDKDGWELFAHRAGASLEEPAMLSTFKEDDKQDFIFDPE